MDICNSDWRMGVLGNTYDDRGSAVIGTSVIEGKESAMTRETSEYTTIRLRRSTHDRLIDGYVRRQAHLGQRITLAQYASDVCQAGLYSLRRIEEEQGKPQTG